MCMGLGAISGTYPCTLGRTCVRAGRASRDDSVMLDIHRNLLACLPKMSQACSQGVGCRPSQGTKTLQAIPDTVKHLPGACSHGAVRAAICAEVRIIRSNNSRKSAPINALLARAMNARWGILLSLPDCLRKSRQPAVYSDLQCYQRQPGLQLTISAAAPEPHWPASRTSRCHQAPHSGG